MSWDKKNWRKKPRVQMPAYGNIDELVSVENSLEALPPLVFAGEVRNLREQLAKVGRGEAFLLQGGDCAESFSEFSANLIRDTFKVMLQMAVVLTFGSKKPVVKIGRMAGQFAKPRSAEFEIVNDQKLPSYRGDIINDIGPNLTSREPDPKRMLQAYTQSAASVNLLRAFSQGGFADIRQVHAWTLENTRTGSRYTQFSELAERISEALDFMEAAGVSSNNTQTLRKVDFFTSHEALLLEYEEALCRIDSLTGNPIAGSGHMLWIGDRTRDPDGAHVDFSSGVENPIGLKCGPSLTKDDLMRLVQKLNPKNEMGRLTLITRFGHDKVLDSLPKLIQTVKSEGFNVVWCCDPMHGNTVKSSSGFKTRRFDHILSEVQNSFKAHRSEGTYLGGVHFEMTGQDVTKCTGGIGAVSDEDLSKRYHTACDPRLNASQSLELAFLVADELVALRDQKRAASQVEAAE